MARRIDCHHHVTHRGTDWGRVAQTVESLRRLGVDACISSHLGAPPRDGPEGMRRGNDITFEAMRRFPGVVLGWCFVHPGFVREAQQEITRCVADGGMVGVKLYNHYFMDEPVQYPIIERCIDLGVPILMHAAHLTAPEDLAAQPRTSSGEHFVAAAHRYPEAMLICGHIGGGGDWEWQLKALREAPSVYLDTSGSVIDRGMIERCVRDLGADRLLFGTDMNHERGVGKLLDARLTARQRERIFGGNLERILARRRSAGGAPSREAATGGGS